MSESKKNSKIEPIFITKEMASDDEMDSVIREDIISEADAIEKELNESSELDQLSAPPGMLDSIIAELKNQGFWEAEDASEADKKDAPDVEVKKEPNNNLEISAGLSIDLGMIGQKRAAGAEELTTDEEVIKLMSPHMRKIYQRGLKAEKKDKKSWQKPLISVACVLFLVVGTFGISMTSEANRKYMIGVWNSIVGDGLSIYINDSVEGLKGNVEEDEAYEVISAELNTGIVKMNYKTKGMIFEKYEMDKNAGWAKVNYSIGDTTAIMYILQGQQGKAHGLKFEGKIPTNFPENFVEGGWKIAEVNNPGDEIVYVAQKEEEETIYIFKAILEEREFGKILNNIKIIN